MFDRELRRFRESVRTGSYVITYHGLDEMDADALTVLDREECALTGRIVERRRDRRSGEWKYLVEGKASDGGDVTVVVKRIEAGRVAVLTVHRS